MLRSLVVAALPLVLSGPTALAQHLLVDFSRVGGVGDKPSHLYPAAGREGEWNRIDLASAGPYALFDDGGAPTGVTLGLGAGLASDGGFDATGLSGDAARLLEDWLEAGAPTSITLAGLADGEYVVYTYAYASDDPLGAATVVSVAGSSDAAQTVGGTSWAGAHVEGVTYARHRVGVAGGTLSVELAPGSTRVTVNGLQLEPVLSGVTPYCFGDGSGTPCPCANAGGLGRGCANSLGAGAEVVASGSVNLSAFNFTVHGTNLTRQQPALLFAGINAVNGGAGTVFGDGLRCAGGAVVRLGVSITNPEGRATWWPGAADGGWAAGDVRRFQIWHRDPTGSPCGAGFNASSGLEVVFAP